MNRSNLRSPVLLALAFCLGCVSLGDLGDDAILRCTIVLRSSSGEPLAGYPILASTRSLWLDPASRVVFTDPEGRVQLLERRSPDPESFALHAPIRRRESFSLYLPEVHSEGMYSVSFLLDPGDTRWVRAEQERYLEAPDGYESIEMITDGSDRRRAPLVRMPYGMGPVPRHPQLEVEARATPLSGERGYELHVVLTLLDVPEQTSERAEVLSSLRRALDRVAVDRGVDGADLEASDITVLVGMGRRELLRALGEPAYCIDRQTLDYEGSHRPFVPCGTDDSDAVYAFSRGLASVREGGRELHLRFNGEGRCNSSRWELTR